MIYLQINNKHHPGPTKVRHRRGKCTAMRSTTKPLYMIIVKDNVNAETLNQKVKYLSCTRIRWEVLMRKQ